MRHYGFFIFFYCSWWNQSPALAVPMLQPKIAVSAHCKRRPGKAVCKNAAKLMSPGASWTFLGTFLGAFWKCLGASGMFLEPFGSHSGSLVESSGRLLGTFWEPSGNFVGASGSLLGAF